MWLKSWHTRKVILNVSNNPARWALSILVRIRRQGWSDLVLCVGRIRVALYYDRVVTP